MCFLTESLKLTKVFFKILNPLFIKILLMFLF